MASDPNSANNSLLVSRSAARLAFRNALCLFVGRGKRYSVKQVSNGSGVPDRVIECAMTDPEGGDYRPPAMEHQLSLCKFLGPEFTTEWIAAAEQGAFWLPDADDAPPGALACEVADSNADITRRAMDGEFDHEDARALRPVGRKLMIVGAQLAYRKAAA